MMLAARAPAPGSGIAIAPIASPVLDDDDIAEPVGTVAVISLGQIRTKRFRRTSLASHFAWNALLLLPFGVIGNEFGRDECRHGIAKIFVLRGEQCAFYSLASFDT